MVIPVGPRELQERYVRFVAAHERVVGIHRTHLVRLDALFASLQHRAFRGEL